MLKENITVIWKELQIRNRLQIVQDDDHKERMGML